jgi:FemAB-related protein (PEP-CTERM system-associated)
MPENDTIMIAPVCSRITSAPEIHVHEGGVLAKCLPRLESYVARCGLTPLSAHPAWLTVLQEGLQQVPYCLEAVQDDVTHGMLPLVYVRSLLFGRFLVSLPFLNYGGVRADDEQTASLLIDRAVHLADQLNVRYLELRHVQSLAHPALNHLVSSKVHMRLDLPTDAGILWSKLSAKVRNQVRKGEKSGLTVAWGGSELLPEFYAVFSHNMRDLGTPVYGRRLFQRIVDVFGSKVELCVVRTGTQAVAAGLLMHGWGISEVPCASSLREFNGTCANMLLYWQMLLRSVERGQSVFDFGRCSPDSPTFRFKKQWGAVPLQAVWQYYQRQGSIKDMRPDNPKYKRLIGLWKRLPVKLTSIIGPAIVRGIP